MDHRLPFERFVDGLLDDVAAALRPIVEASGLCWLAAAARLTIRPRSRGATRPAIRPRPGRR